MVFVEGATDMKYIQTAAALLKKQALLEKFELRNGGGSSNLDNVWRISKLPDSLSEKIVLLYDCDNRCTNQSKGNMHKRKIPIQKEHPIKKGIENLFPQATLEKAKNLKSAFINIKFEHKVQERGKKKTIPEEWAVDPDEKSNLCEWLCENGDTNDFQHFQKIFSLLDEMLSETPSTAEQGGNYNGS